MLEINCSTLQFWGHGAYIEHMYFIHDKSTRVSCLYNHIKLVRSGLYWVIKGPHVMRF